MPAEAGIQIKHLNAKSKNELLRENKNVRGGHTKTDPALILSRIACLVCHFNNR
jgi:hypothetical protein